MLRRIRNLWYLSGLNIDFNKEDSVLVIDDRPVKIKKKNRQAEIIDLINPLDAIEI